jgi:hypothetical protein
MTAPLVHLITGSIKGGQLEAYRKFAQEHAEFAEAKHPRLLAFHLYLSADGREVTSFQVHPDADSMDFFIKEVVATHGVKAFEYLEQGSERSEVYGTLNQATVEQFRQYGVALRHSPYHLAGFTRLRTQ